MNERWSKVGLVVNAATLCVLLGVGAQLMDLKSRNLVSIEDIMDQTISSSWVSGGITHTITTPKNVGESDADWITRHDNAVRAAKVIYPPD